MGRGIHLYVLFLYTGIVLVRSCFLAFVSPHMGSSVPIAHQILAAESINCQSLKYVIGALKELL
jgi:uncharacterized membrane protein